MIHATFGDEKIEFDSTVVWPRIEKLITTLQQEQPTIAFLAKGFLATAIMPKIADAAKRPGFPFMTPNMRCEAARQNGLVYMVAYLLTMTMAMAESETWDILYEIEERPDGPVTVLTGMVATAPAVAPLALAATNEHTTDASD